jgi:hypothetical protein
MQNVRSIYAYNLFSNLFQIESHNVEICNQILVAEFLPFFSLLRFSHVVLIGLKIRAKFTPLFAPPHNCALCHYIVCVKFNVM